MILARAHMFEMIQAANEILTMTPKLDKKGHAVVNKTKKRKLSPALA